MIAVSIDGQMVDAERASISVFDRGLLYGDGCFEVLRTWHGVARDLEAHLDRLFDTARFLQLATLERPRLTEAVYKTIAAAEGPGEQRIRIVLTRGRGALNARLGELGPGRAIVIVEPLPPQPTELALAVVDWPIPKRAIGRKTLAYLDAVLARELARAAGADEAVRLDAAGHAVEGATCNLFTVLHGTISTPAIDRGVLPGIVRGRVLALSTREGIATRIRDLSLRDLRAAHEIFVTSSLRGVVPVTRIDHVSLARGPVTARIASAYADAMRV